MLIVIVKTDCETDRALHSTTHHAGVQLLEAVGRGGAAVAVASVRADDGARGRGELRGGGQPAAQLAVQLRAVARVPAVGVRGSPHRHPAAGRGGEVEEVTRGHCGHLAVVARRVS